MAPGEGVPDTRLGAFGGGIGTDCNECGFQVPEGARMLWGGHGGRTTWLVRRGRFDRLTRRRGGSTASRSGGPVTAVAVSVRTERRGAGSGTLAVVVHALDRARERDHAAPEAFIAAIRGMQAWSEGRTLWNDLHDRRPAQVDLSLPPTLRLRIPRGEVGFENAHAAALTIARAFIDDSPTGAVRERERLGGGPDREASTWGPGLKRVGSIAFGGLALLAFTLCAPGAVIGLLGKDRDAVLVGLTLLVTGALLGSSMLGLGWAFRRAVDDGLQRSTGAEHWEADEHGFVASSSWSDGRRAFALGIPAASMERLAPCIETSEGAPGDVIAWLVSRHLRIRGIALPGPAPRARAEAERVLAAIGHAGSR
jgi:hypothetical protein